MCGQRISLLITSDARSVHGNNTLQFLYSLLEDLLDCPYVVKWLTLCIFLVSIADLDGFVVARV